MVGAALLRVQTYEEVESDRSATWQALAVVVLVAIATGVGASTSGGVSRIIVGVVGALIVWALWALITYVVGTTLFRTPETKADWGELARTLGFAQSPGVLKAFGAIPAIGPVIFFAVAIWQLAAMVTAIRQALDYTSTLRAVGVAVVGFIPSVLLLILIGIMTG
jgi:hypothetical protein